MKFFLMLALAVLWSVPLRAEDAPPAVAVPVTPVISLEEDIIKSMMIFCLPPIIKNFDAATLPVTFKLREMPAENAQLFDPTGGRVFASENYPDNILIIAGKNGACSVVARSFNTEKFWGEVDKMFGPGTPFSLLAEKSIPGGRQKDYEANYAGPTALFISARDAPQDGMLQGILTYARVGGQATAIPAKP